ncbi:kinase-like domain-containing protein [Fomitopsis serialis]|uniref:kinase-like domain-containing protein n=1 Tax=Fomitopsis serialis TaxID=139415 RepID=UPI002007E989|nr:kinase-like domain-containing protein [Neoantrodia serialis]KAH9930606.1 kinase-like domain-containing protein [Neoantrodia serialis]
MSVDLASQHALLINHVDHLRPRMESLRQLLQFCQPYVTARRDNNIPFHLVGFVLHADRWLWSLHQSIGTWRHFDTTTVLTNLLRIGEELANLYNSCPSIFFELQSSSRISSPTTLANSQAKYEMQDKIALLKGCLNSSAEVEKLMNADADDATALIDVLDDAMNSIEPYDRLYSTVFHTLRKICVKQGILPTSLSAATRDLLIPKDGPVAFGGFAEVWRGRLGRQDVGVKVIRIAAKGSVDSVLKSFCREAITWKRLSHARVVPFFGIDRQHFPLSMVCKWMIGGDIISFVKDNPKANRPLLILDVAHGLEYLHSTTVGIVHGDLKGANILIDEHRRACLSDFGLTTILYQPETIHIVTNVSVFASTARWMAPELHDPDKFGLEHGNPTKESDIYSFSMVMWEVFTERFPFDESRLDAQVINKVLTGKRPLRPTESPPLSMSSEVWGIMEKCWREDRHKRPRISVVLLDLKRAFYFNDKSIPIPHHLELDRYTGPSKDDIVPGTIERRLKITLIPTLIIDILPEKQTVAAGKWLMNYTLSWERCRVFRPLEHHRGDIKTSWRCKDGNNESPWDCRVSKHDSRDLTLDQLWHYRAVNKYSIEMLYVPELKSAKMLSEYSPTESVWSVRYRYPFFQRERQFYISQTMFLDKKARRGIVIYRPVELPGERIPSDVVVGRYAGAEQFAELDNGQIEWRLAETWALGGNWTPSNRPRDGAIAQTVVDFFKWFNATVSTERRRSWPNYAPDYPPG